MMTCIDLEMPRKVKALTFLTNDEYQYLQLIIELTRDKKLHIRWAAVVL